MDAKGFALRGPSRGISRTHLSFAHDVSHQCWLSICDCLLSCLVGEASHWLLSGCFWCQATPCACSWSALPTLNACWRWISHRSVTSQPQLHLLAMSNTQPANDKPMTLRRKCSLLCCAVCYAGSYAAGCLQVFDLLGDDPALPGGRERTESVIKRLRAAFTGGAPRIVLACCSRTNLHVAFLSAEWSSRARLPWRP